MKTNPADVRILLVEDAKTMRKLEVKILSSLGYTDIIEVEDGLEAKKILEKGTEISLIISDWNMPNMSGYEFLTWVRTKSDRFINTPFILATAQSDKAQAIKAKTAGVTSIIAKPFTAEELQKKIEQAIDPEKSKVQALSKKNTKTASGKTILRVAHLQITDHLLLGLVKEEIEQGSVKPKNFELETKLMGSWNPVAEAIENNEVDAAFLLAPIAMDLFAHRVPINTILLAHRGGSIMVRNSQGAFMVPCEDFFRKKSFLIPHKLSIHHMLSHMFFKGIGLKASLDKGDDVDVNFEVAAPVTMPQFLAKSEQMAGFMVAEPIGSKAININIAKKQFMSNELWPDHPCCLLVMRQEFVDNFPDSTQEFVNLLVESGQKFSNNIQSAARTGVKFLDPEGKVGLKEAILEKVISDPHGIRWDNLYPDIKEFEVIREYMENELGVLKKIDQNKFVNFRFADIACKGKKSAKSMVFPQGGELFERLLNRSHTKARDEGNNREQTSLSQLLFEKGIHSQMDMDPELFKKMAETQKKLEQENSALQGRAELLEAKLKVLNGKRELLFKNGVQYLKDERLFESAGFFNAVLAFEPDNMKALNNLAVIYYEMEMFEKAKSTFEKILDLDPENKIARENLMDLKELVMAVLN